MKPIKNKLQMRKYYEKEGNNIIYWKVYIFNEFVGIREKKFKHHGKCPRLWDTFIYEFKIKYRVQGNVIRSEYHSEKDITKEQIHKQLRTKRFNNNFEELIK